MATIKNNWLRTSTLILLGLVMAFGAQSFTNKEEVKPVVKPALLTQQWHFNGSSTDSPTDASKYSLAASEPCNGEAETICRINAPANPLNPSQPDMSAIAVPASPSSPAITVGSQITAAQSSKNGNETVLSFREY